MTTVIWAIVKKETLVAFRSSRWHLLSALTFSLVVQFWMLQNFVSKSAAATQSISNADRTVQSVVAMGPTVLLLYVAPVFIPFLANGLLARSFSTEKMNGSLAMTVAAGVDVGVLWAIKTVVIFALCYAISLVVMVADIGALRYYFNVPVSIAPSTMFLATVISPITALAITALMSFLYWTIRMGMFVAGMLPMMLVMAVLYLARADPTAAIMLKWTTLVTIGAASVLAACAWIINSIGRARVLGL